MKVSVALAAYHGEQFIEEQLQSILTQLNRGDEVIVSDDAPGGETQAIVERMAKEDDRLHYIAGPGKGVIANFNHAIAKTSGDVIFLADQDDVWLPNKVTTCLAALEGADLVLHNATVVDGDLTVKEPSFFASHGSKPGLLTNFIRNSYMGCCMAFKAGLKPYILPIPATVPMHDQYIGLQAEKYGKVAFIEEPLLLYRVHGGNVTGRATSLKEKLTWRMQIAAAVLLPHKKSEPATGNGITASIVTYNNEGKIGDAVGSILNNVKAKDFTLYVVDNGSTDRTLSILREQFGEDPRLVVLETGENVGFGAGHNKVLPRLTSKYHCVVNPDILLMDDAVEKMEDYMDSHPDVVQLAPRIRFPDGTDQVLGKRYPMPYYLVISHFRNKEAEPNVFMRYYAMMNKYDAPFEIKNASGCFMFFRTDAFKALGGFDERYFMYFEDCDITREMHKLGKVVFHPDITVYHAWERASKSNPALRKIHIESMFRYYKKWYTFL